MKTYADVLISPVLGARLLAVSCSGSVVLISLFALKIDNYIADVLSDLLGINVSISYWLVYLFGSIFLLIVNLCFTYLAIRGCTSDPNDWDRVKKIIFDKRPIYNFTKDRKEMMRVPVSLLMFFVLLLIFGIWRTFDILIWYPLCVLATGEGVEHVFKFDFGVIYGLFIFCSFPPYILLLAKILVSRCVFDITQKLRRGNG